MLQNLDKIGMNRQTILLIIALVALGSTGYLWVRYSKLRPAQDLDVKKEKSDEYTERLLSEVKRLRKVQLDTSLFQDRLFQSLKEPPAPLETAVTPGRTNPFAPF